MDEVELLRSLRFTLIAEILGVNRSTLYRRREEGIFRSTLPYVMIS